MKYNFEKFQRPTATMRDELKKVFEELKNKGPEYSVVIDRSAAVLYHQAKVLGFKLTIHKINDKTSRVWIKDNHA